MPRRTQDNRSNRLPWQAAAGVGLLAFLLYLPTVAYDFTFDDGVIVARNPAVQEWGQWKLVFASDYWPGVHSALYRPLTILSFAAERVIHGSGPAGFHLLNVLLHSLTSVFVLLVAAEMTGPGWGALAAALVFAVHPIHTEVVGGVVGRAELLSSLLALWAFWLYLRKVRTRRASRAAQAGIAILYFLALCAKENVIVLPVLILFWELSRSERRQNQSALRRLASQPAFWGLLAAGTAFLWLRSLVLGGFSASLATHPPFVENPLSREPAATRVISALADQARGLWLQVFPHPLLADYSYSTLPVHSTWLTPGFLAMVSIFLLVPALWALRKTNVNNLAFSSSWYLLSILPTSNILFVIGTVFGERLFYFPSAGFCLCISSLWAMIADRESRPWQFPASLSGKAGVCAASAVLFAFGFATRQRIPVWRNNLALFSDTVARAPLNVKARLWLGDALVVSGHPAGAVREYRKALEIYPDYEAVLANIVVPLTRLGQLDEAIAAGEKARVLFRQENDIILYNLANAYLKNGNPVRFLDYMHRALAINPQNSAAQLQLGMYYLRQEGNRQEARKHFAAALRLAPTLPEASAIRSWFPDLR